MADLNALIAQGVQFKAPPDPFAQYAKMQELQRGEETGQMNQMLMQEKQRGFQEYNALRGVMSRPGFDLSTPASQGEVYKVAPTLAENIIKGHLGNVKTAAETKNLGITGAHTQAQTDELAIKAIGNTFDNFIKLNSPLAAVRTPESVAAYITNLYGVPLLGAIAKAQKPLEQAIKENVDAAAKDPQAWIAAHSGLTGAQIFNTLKGTRQTTNLGGSSLGQTIDPYGRVVPGSGVSTPITPVPISGGESARLKQAEEHFTRRLAEETATGALSPDTLEFAGQLVAQGGAMPPLGSGKAAAKLKQQILDRAAQISTADGSSGAEAAAKVLTAKAAQSGATAAERVLGSQGANVLLASSEAKKMIRVASDYSNSVDRSQYPTLNSIQNAIDKGTGGENIVALNTALNALVNSYARAINPRGVSTVSDKNHAREIVNAAYSKGQLNTVFKVMDQEMIAALESTGAAREVLRAKPNAAAPAGVDAALWNEMTPEERKLWQK